MAEPGVELIVGLVRDPQYGPAVLVGIGGVLAEVLDDTVLALAPLTSDEALRCSGDFVDPRFSTGSADARPSIEMPSRPSSSRFRTSGGCDRTSSR
jgi:hypothetical protein